MNAKLEVGPHGIPLYQQIRGRVVADILGGQLATNAAIPSIRQVASQLQVNPLTVAKAYQLLETQGWILKHRGGAYTVVDHVRSELLEKERAAFLQNEWEYLKVRALQLGLHIRIDPLDLDSPGT